MKTLEKAIEVALIPVEKEALEQWEDQGLPKISITTAAKYYDLYLQGSSCSEIATMNPGIHLGAIVNAKVKYGWDRQKELYIEDLMAKTKQQASKVFLESVKFLGNWLNTVHMRSDMVFGKFAQTKDVSELTPLEQLNSKEYRSNLELFFRLTGQDTKSMKGPSVNVNVTSSGNTSVDFDDDMSSSDLLKRLAENKNKE